jgi:serine/threonine protein kinase
MTIPADASLDRGVEAESRARVGSTIDGKWRVDRLLGVGGVAAVYAASHPCGRVAAMKVLHRRYARDEAVCRRFFAERAISARVHHAACVTIFGSSATDDGAPLLVMELLDGDTLEVARQRWVKLPLTHALFIVERLLDFLIACHSAGVIHRDLKPDNVFLMCDGHVRVIDFGIAHVLGTHRTDPRIVLGTPEFMSPEQASGKNNVVDETSDLFAIGAILFTLLSGSLLRSGRDAHETLQIAAKEPPRSLALVAPEVPACVASLVDRALAWEPAERWPSARLMHAETRRVLDEIETRPSPVPTAMRLSNPLLVVPASLRPTFPSAAGLALGASSADLPTFTERSDEVRTNSQARIRAVRPTSGGF